MEMILLLLAAVIAAVATIIDNKCCKKKDNNSLFKSQRYAGAVMFQQTFDEHLFNGNEKL